MNDSTLRKAVYAVLEGSTLPDGVREILETAYYNNDDTIDRETLDALLKLSQIEPIEIYELANQYWPRTYFQLCVENSWWLVFTLAGPIVIGWRKRVISIDWSKTNIRTIITEDDVTKDETSVHAWGVGKAVAYLTTLGCQIKACDGAEALLKYRIKPTPQTAAQRRSQFILDKA
jgi:hypothetical protein